jgi:hypothetical protein
MKIVVTARRQMNLPVEICQQDGITSGQTFRVDRIDAGHYLLTRELPKKGKGIVEWLRSCPTDGWFQPISSETRQR